MTLTTRETATAFWLIAVLLFGLWRSGDARRGLARTFAILLGPKLLVPLVLYVLWMVAHIWVASLVGAWTPPMVKDTLFCTVPGFALWVGAGEASSAPGYFRGRLRGVVGLSILVGYYVALATFALAVEIVLQFFVLLLVAYSAYGIYVQELRSAKVWADRVLAFVGLVLIAYAVIVAINSWATADKVQVIGCKTTARERWRQLLKEARRVQRKSLLTLDTGLTAATVDAMNEADVQVYLPAPLIAAHYGPPLNASLGTVGELLQELHAII